MSPQPEPINVGDEVAYTNEGDDRAMSVVAVRRDSIAYGPDNNRADEIDQGAGWRPAYMFRVVKRGEQ